VKHRTLTLLAAAVALAGCQRQAPAASGTIPRERFIAANVAVRTLSDSATPAERRVALRKAGVTERQLRAWVAVHAREPETLAKTWERIAFRVDSISGARPIPLGGKPPAVTDLSPPSRNRDSVLQALQRRRDSLDLLVAPEAQVRPGPAPRPGPAQPPRPGPRRRPRAIQQ
jgi:hypothetical protein